MYVDFKVQAWERVDCPEEYLDEVKGLVAKGEIKTSNDLVTFLEEKESAYEYGMVMESETQMTVGENGGDATIEVFDDYGDVIQNNEHLNG